MVYFASGRDCCVDSDANLLSTYQYAILRTLDGACSTFFCVVRETLTKFGLRGQLEIWYKKIKNVVHNLG